MTYIFSTSFHYSTKNNSKSDIFKSYVSYFNLKFNQKINKFLRFMLRKTFFINLFKFDFYSFKN